jgi:hypothetical protein
MKTNQNAWDKMNAAGITVILMQTPARNKMDHNQTSNLRVARFLQNVAKRATNLQRRFHSTWSKRHFTVAAATKTLPRQRLAACKCTFSMQRGWHRLRQALR